MGAIDNPLHPLSIAIGCEGTFVARSIDVNIKHLGAVLKRAAEHRGTAFIEVYQNCNVFNDGAWDYATDRNTKADTTIELEHGKPLIFGKNRDRGIRLNGMEPEVVELGKGITEDDLLFHDEQSPEPSLAYLLTRMRHPEHQVHEEGDGISQKVWGCFARDLALDVVGYNLLPGAEP